MSATAHDSDCDPRHMTAYAVVWFHQRRTTNLYGNPVRNFHFAVGGSKWRFVDSACYRKDTGADPHCDRLGPWDRRPRLGRVSDRDAAGTERDLDRRHGRDIRNRPCDSDPIHRAGPNRRRLARMRFEPGRRRLLRRVGGAARVVVLARRDVLSRRYAYRAGEQLRRSAFSFQRYHFVCLRREPASTKPDLRRNEVYLSVFDRFSDRILYTMRR